jgi:hypothetical protein
MSQTAFEIRNLTVQVGNEEHHAGWKLSSVKQYYSKDFASTEIKIKIYSSPY